MWHVTSKLHAQHDDIELDNGMGLSLSTMGIRKYVRLCNINESMMHCNLSNTKKDIYSIIFFSHHFWTTCVTIMLLYMHTSGGDM